MNDLLLTTVTFASSPKLISLGNAAFSGCSSLPSFSFPDLISVHVTNSYNYTTFCGVEVFRARGSECDLVFATGYVDAQAFRKNAIGILGNTLVLHVIINM
ncbi:hypothetical protein TVAG_433810 [Trichomonas vaginalis G3]|uniref:Surface antigen BspA-like n=1 Tax=Trichomonas vaginalis (strain ATCC PRA-98 / G3) TaxID=412133 RepID=A2F7S6_TRIV3|nr:leucine-rich repeats (6 copies)-containing protein [Trichomonas vaginalis G3]EAX99053.1 hypothetical protein TVAG_433810 [Trichomonas vaginalis G3]KAI5553789.1 leucine-rich repeats (6 copies)-containing protein [Trichomonas vaginalis G3]|eukprot:XP_001311983.1 hypothetical protein [Trichomonas vaginalis G3]